MLQLTKKSQVLLIILSFFLILDFVFNVWVGNSSNGKSLNVDDWDNSVLVQKGASELPAINEIFGLKPDVDKAAEAERLRREQAEAEMLAQAQREAEKNKVLSIGAKDVRLFGITLYDNRKVAMFRVQNQAGTNELLQIGLGETIEFQKGKVVVSVEEILTDTVRLAVENKDAQETTRFNLVIFNYGF